ncbi:MAG TPA: type III-B CRISPR module RAMP protein Cmr1, partial [Syntrophales bacterium]|nr:type III-B CRISPR module RAMP protein Cmr1 [Syntrophales bacterium]
MIKKEVVMFYVSRFNGIEKRQYECEVVTPMFLGGADPRGAELRVPPIKGAMRFWWRATCGIESIKEMAEEEAKIFGSTEKKSKVSLWIENIDAEPKLEKLPEGTKVPVEGKTYSASIVHYLAYGFYERLDCTPGVRQFWLGQSDRG